MQKVTIQEMSWEYCINIEKYQTVTENNWNLPAGARLLYSQQEFSHYQEVLDHYETRTKQVAKQRISGYEDRVTGYRDLGNGYFEEITTSSPVYETYYETETYQEPIYRNDPVYRTKYYYEIDKWLYERNVKTSGKDKNPYWGEVDLSSVERISSKNEKYLITGVNQKDKQQVLQLSYDDWRSLTVGKTATFKVTLGIYGEIVE